MRVISGKYKGRKLVSFKLEHIRPTTDRVKGSLFNILAGRVGGARVLDLFSGTGSLGIEALSRGATEVTMVENDKRSIQVIQRNLESLGIDDGVKISRADVIKYLLQYEGSSYGIILIDPPFPLKICSKTLEAVSSSKAANDLTTIIIETSVHEPLPTEVKTLRCVDTRDYGDKLLWFYEKKEA